MIRSYFKYAENSSEEKQKERFEKVLNEISDFKERFGDSKLMEEVTKFKTQTDIFLKNINTTNNEQTKKTA